MKRRTLIRPPATFSLKGEGQAWPSPFRERVPEGRGRVLLAVALAIVIAQPTWATPPPLPEFPPLNFKPPKAVRTVLDNGLVIFLLEDHELPLVKATMYFRAGSQYDPTDKIGLGSIFGSAMTHGGSASHTPEEIEKILDLHAASISFSIGLENGEGSFGCRAADFDTIFGLFSDLALRPQFRKDQVELAKSKAQESLRRLNDDPDEVARRELRRILYGKHHPYARIPSPPTIRSIKRDDLLAAHKRFLRPNASWLAISGDFKSDEMLSKIKKALGSWAKSDVTWPPIPAPTPPPEKRVYYVQRPITQSQIRIGNFGLARHSPDHFAWEVFNELWGGSANSRLFRVIRSQLGLAYSVGSAYSEPAQTGLIVAVSQTRGSQTIAAVQAIQKITEELRAAPFSESEITNAKDAIRNRFVENFTSSSQIVAYVMNLEYFGFPADYLDTYTQQIARVSADDLRRMGKTYLRTDLSTILVMGDLSTFDKPLATLGKPQEIKVIDYTQENP